MRLQYWAQHPPLTMLTVSPVESTSDYPAGSEISLLCSWDTSVYYVSWYKNGMLIYEEDLANSSVLMGPPQGIYVGSNYTTMMSTLTIVSAALDDSGNYTCAVTCGAKGVEFGMIAENLQDTAEVFVYGHPGALNNPKVVIKANDSVTAVISWMALMDNATGIPPRGNQTLRYFVEVINRSSAVLFSATVYHPTNMMEAPNLPACETLTVSVTVENLFFNGTPASEDFMTVEPADPVVTLTPAVDPLKGNVTDSVTLTCSWNSTVFYLVWFKDGALLYSMDLVSGDTVDSTSASVSVEVEGLSSTLTFSQVGDSGNYTCAVTCRAKDSAEEDIPVQFRATKEVFIYVAPVATISPKPSVNVSEGRSAVVMCTATGVPAPTISWFRNGVPLSDGGTTLLITSSTDDSMALLSVTSTLNVTSVMRESAFATITCTASNGVGANSSGSTQLVVLFAPDVTAISANQEVTSPDSVSLNCTVDSYPPSTIIWFYNGVEVQAALPRVTISTVQVDNRTQESTLTLLNTTLEDDGTYTCSAENDEGMTNMTTELRVWEPPNAPSGLVVVIKADSTTPVTAVIFWMALMNSATGIPPGGNQTLRYFVEVSNSSAVLFSTTVDHPTNMTEAPNLPACENLTVLVTAENLIFNGTTASKKFMTVEPADPLVTLTPAVDRLKGNATDSVTLTCSWNSTVFYLIWFKDGALLYSRDLVSEVISDNTNASVTVEVEGLSSTLTFSQVGDSGNYTCAVTCRAKDSAEEDIPVQFRVTKEVLIFDVPSEVMYFAASVGFLSVTFTWTPPSFLGVPPTLDPADFIYYILDVSNDTDSVGGAIVSYPTTTVMVNLTYPCEEYTATIFAKNKQAGNGPPTMETFALNETSAVNVSLSPMEDPVTYLFRAASANVTIMLSCSWDAEVYYAAWLRNGAPFYREDRVRGVQLEEYGSFSGTASVTTNFAAQSSTLLVTDAFITDSANYTCAVTCRARQVVRGEVLEVSEEFSATRGVLVLAVPDDLVATERRPTYLVVQWTAPPSPFSGNYQLTYGPNGTTMVITVTTVSGVSLNITGLQPFTNYRVSVQASNAPVVDYGPTLSGVFATLPEAEIPPGVDPPAVVIPQAGVGSSEIVEIVIPAPTFQQDHLSHLWVVCIRNILPTTRNTAPDTAFPDNSTFGTYDNAEDNVPYIASEFGAAGINFPYTFGVGNESELNDFPNQYRNGPVMAGRNLDCFIRYFVSTEVMPMRRRRRRGAVSNRQYDEFQSTEYSTVNMATLIHPENFTVVIVDPSTDSDPVTVNFSWTALDNVTFDGQNITYTVTVSYQNGSEVANRSIPHPSSSLEIPALPACANLTATLVAERGNESSNGTVDQFMTSEPTAPPTVTVSPMESLSDYQNGSDISLLCSWDTSVYYVSWYMNSMLIYEEDLAASSVLMGPPQRISVDSNYITTMSTLTIVSAALDDSGSYTCAVTCGAKGVEFGMIAGNLTDTAEVFVYEPPNAPNNLTVVITANDTTPVTVTAVISWMALMGSATGIPLGGNQTLRYFVVVSNSSLGVLFSTTVDHPTNMTEAADLPACENLTVSVTAENLFFNGTTASKDFMTVEPGDPVVTLTPAEDTLEGNATNNITLTCSWNSTVFYLVWFKDGAPLYSRDLVSGDTVDNTNASMTVEVEGLSSTLTFSRVSDSGNYTCAVTCRAKDSEEEDIPVQFRTTKEVLIYDVPGEVMDFAASVGFLSVTFTWTPPSFLGVPPTLDPADFINYILDVRNDTDSVGGATVPHPTTTVMVNLPYPCEEYTATIFARNRQAGNGPSSMETFQLNETGAVNVILSPMEDPVTYLFRAASANNTIMLSCSWDAEVYYVAWLRNGAPFYREDRVRGVQPVEHGSFSGTASVTTNFAAQSSTLQVTDAFITDSANYTCAVTCRARQVVRGDVLEVSEEFSATREVLVLAVPDDLVATERRPAYLVVQWTAPPSPFSGNYRLTYGPLGGMMTPTTVSSVSLNITGLQPFTNYMVSVQASNAPVVDFGPTLSEVFHTLPEIPPGVGIPTLVVPQVGDGSSGIVEIIIPSPPFERQDILSHLWVVCIRNILPTTRDTVPDTAFPDSSTFGTYDNAGDDVPYIASEFDMTRVNLPHTFGVGDESEPNDFPNQYRNGPVMAGSTLDCFVRYFVSTEAMPMARRRRDVIPNRQYDIFLSTGYINVNRIPLPDQSGLIAGLVVSLLVVAILVAAVVALVIFIIYRRKLEGHGKYPPPSRQGSIRLRDNIAMVSFQAGPEGLSPNEVKHPVKVKLFEKHVAQRHRNSDHLFSEEYELLSIRSPSLPHNVGAEPYNVAKNRYANIHSADESRVKLQPIEGRPGSDYINANYIDGYKTAKAFLATQGPMVNTTHDFWRMVWEQNSHTIIMLTNVVEKTRVKCHQYWPEPVGSSVTLADLTVTLIDQQDLADMVIRTFHLTKEDCKEKRQIQQLHYITWPDFGVPEQAVPILQLIGRVNELNPPDAGPIVTHCSAGVGRTGTLITIYSMIKMIEDVEEVDVFNYVLKMRSQRTYMVQTEKQYVFIHDALLKYLKIRGHEMPVKVLRKRYQALKEENPETGQDGIIAEFAKLESLSLIDEAWLVSGTLPANTHKNRSKDVLPYDPYRVRLTMFPGVEGSDYINSTYMDGYQCRNQFILTQGPLDLTIFDFWRMIWETRASTIVMLCQLQENDFEQCARYWPVPEEGVMQYGAFLIETERVQEHASGFTIRDISITNTKHYSERRLLKQFQYKEWPDSHLPATAANIIDLIGLILKSQIQHGKGPVVIHDSGSVGRSATFCALCSILERMKSERLVDIFTTVHAMRTRLPRAVCSTDLYHFLYQTSVEYLDSFDHYSNFE